MKREETVKIIRIICDCYPNYKPNNLTETVDVWNMMLSDYTYEQISLALKAYILADTNGFAPSIGQLVDRVNTFSQPQELNELQAWSLVYKAIRNSSYNSEYEFSMLPDVVRKAIGNPNQLRTWAMDENFNEQVISSHFIRCYRLEVARDRDFRKMPANIQSLISNNSNNQINKRIQEFDKNMGSVKENENKLLKCFENTVPMPDKFKELKDSLKYIS